MSHRTAWLASARVHVYRNTSPVRFKHATIRGRRGAVRCLWLGPIYVSVHPKTPR